MIGTIYEGENPLFFYLSDESVKSGWSFGFQIPAF